MESVDSDPLGMIALIISDDEVKLEFDEECPPEQCSRKNEDDISLMNNAADTKDYHGFVE